MDRSFRAKYRYGAVAVWTAGLVGAWLLNGRRSEITSRSALLLVGILCGLFAVWLVTLLSSARVRRVAIADEAAFHSRRAIFAWSLAVLVLVSLVSLGKALGG